MNKLPSKIFIDGGVPAETRQANTSSIVTIPAKVFVQWAQAGFPQPDADYSYLPAANLKPIPYQPDVTIGKPWESYDLRHDLTDKGLAAFWGDWNQLFT